MAKKLFIHIGLMKTGSSSIQQALLKNHQLLKNDYSINYPIALHHHNMMIFPIFKDHPHAFPDWKRQYSADEAKCRQKQLFDALKRAFAKNEQEVFVISSELLGFLSEKEILAMKHFCEPFFDEIQIMMYIRHPISFIPSLIQQDILNGFNPEQLDINRYIEKYKYKVEYKAIIQKYINVFTSDKMIFKNFDNHFFYNGNLIEDFFLHMGKLVPLDELEITIENEALKHYSALFLSEYNKKYPIMINNKRNPHRGLSSSRLPERLYKDIEDKRFSLNILYREHEAAYLNGEIEYVNQYLHSNEQFEQIRPTKDQTELIDVHSIPIDYFVELINGYNKYLDQILKKLERNKKTESHEKNSMMMRLYQLGGQRRSRIFKNKLYLMFHKTHDAFDEKYYCHEYPEIHRFHASPFAHFVLQGIYEGKKPNAHFDIVSILDANPRMVINGENPLLTKKFMKTWKGKTE